MIVLTISTALIMALSFWAGNVLSVRLPLFNQLLNHKPFNCRPCLTFHLCWIAHALAAGLTHYPPLFGMGLVAAFALFFITKHIDEQKIEL